MKYNYCLFLIISLFSLGGIVPMNIQERLDLAIYDNTIGLVLWLDHPKRSTLISAERCGTGLKIRELGW